MQRTYQTDPILEQNEYELEFNIKLKDKQGNTFYRKNSSGKNSVHF